MICIPLKFQGNYCLADSILAALEDVLEEPLQCLLRLLAQLHPGSDQDGTVGQWMVSDTPLAGSVPNKSQLPNR